MYLWYRYCVRIYNRFKYVETNSTWLTNEIDPETRIREFSVDNNSRKGNIRSVSSNRKKRKKGIIAKIFNTKNKSFSSNGDEGTDTTITNNTTGNEPIINNLGPRQNTYNHVQYDDLDNTIRHGAKYGLAGIAHEGYVTIHQSGIFGPKKIRHFLLLVENKLVWYESKRAYELDPDKPVNLRPVYIENYRISTRKEDGNIYCLQLSPEKYYDEKKIFEFRCDTIDEVTGWTNAFQAVLRSHSTTNSSLNKNPLLMAASVINPNTGGNDDISENDSLLKRVPSISGGSKR